MGILRHHTVNTVYNGLSTASHAIATELPRYLTVSHQIPTESRCIAHYHLTVSHRLSTAPQQLPTFPHNMLLVLCCCRCSLMFFGRVTDYPVFFLSSGFLSVDSSPPFPAPGVKKDRSRSTPRRIYQPTFLEGKVCQRCEKP